MLIERLTEQLISSRRINPNEAKRMAKGLLEKQGSLNPDGSYTRQGLERSRMTPGQRAVGRARKRSGSGNYVYDSRKNYAYKRKTLGMYNPMNNS